MKTDIEKMSDMFLRDTQNQAISNELRPFSFHSLPDIMNLAINVELDLLRPHTYQLLLQGPRDPAVNGNVQGLVALPLIVVVAADEEELEDPALLCLGLIVEEQDPAVHPEGPEPPEPRVLRLQRCHPL